MAVRLTKPNIMRNHLLFLHIHTPDIIRDTVNYIQGGHEAVWSGVEWCVCDLADLLAARFDQIMGFIEKRPPECK